MNLFGPNTLETSTMPLVSQAPQLPGVAALSSSVPSSSADWSTFRTGNVAPSLKR